jgi:hypothetical protein
MKQLFLIAATVASLFSCAKNDLLGPSETASTPKEEATAWTNVFFDDFNAGGNLSKWTLASRADYNSSKCIYNTSAASIGTLDSKSCLLITANKTATGFQSAFCTSNFSFKPANNEEYHTYATFKVLAKSGTTYKGFGETYGAWPAFWTVQGTNWPIQGEIDIVEGYSFGGSTRFASNLFYGTTAGVNLLGNTAERQFTIGEGWHTYEQFWKNQNNVVTVTIVVDGVTVSTYTNAVNGNLKLEKFGPHNVILNLNVGSNSNLFNNSLINLFDQTLMYTDYVRVDKRGI